MSSRQSLERPESPSSFIYTPRGMSRSCTDRSGSYTSYATTSTEQYSQITPGPFSNQSVFRSIDWQGTTSRGIHDRCIPSPRTTKAEPEDISPPLGPGQPGHTNPLASYHIRHSEQTQLHSVHSMSQRPLARLTEPRASPLLAHPSPRKYSRPTFLPPPESPEHYTPPPPFGPPAAATTIRQTRDICQAATQRHILAQAQTEAQSTLYPSRPRDNNMAKPVIPRDPAVRAQRTRHARRHAPYPALPAPAIFPRNHPSPPPGFNPSPHQQHRLPNPFHEPSRPPLYGKLPGSSPAAFSTSPHRGLGSSDGDTTPGGYHHRGRDCAQNWVRNQDQDQDQN
jgi:hypothetical protein